jgi:uracil-DNA glycosylase
MRKIDKTQDFEPRRSPAPLVQRTEAREVIQSLEALRTEAVDCRACPLWRNATQTVFGEGRARASVMLVGEQPGDQEDLAGRPFVGGAGQVLDRALAEAGIDRDEVYITNAVKHFKYEPRGKRRIHKKPSEREIEACHPWLEHEMDLVRPALVVALGASAARALLGRTTVIERNRGKLQPLLGGARLLITVHPSYLLRVPDPQRAEAYQRFVEDLKLALPFLGGTTDLDRL